MRLDYALLASSAEEASRNRIHILGANISTWGTRSFPVDASFAFVAKLDFDTNEFNQSYTYRIEISGPNSDEWQRLTPDNQFVSPTRADRPELGTSMTIMAHVRARLSDQGDYSVRLVVDGVAVAHRPLYAHCTDASAPR